MNNSTVLAYWQEVGFRAFHSYIFVWLFPLLMSVGIFGNISCLVVMVKYPKSFPYSVRLSMLITCCADVLMVGGKAATHYISPTVMGRTLGIEDYRRTVSYSVCMVYYFFTFWLLHGSPFIRLGLCFHSLVVTLAPMKRAVILSKRNVLLYQLLLLLLSTVPCLRLFSAEWRDNRCRFEFDWIEVFYRIFTVFGSRVLVFCILIGSLAIIVAHMRRGRRQLSGSINHGSRHGGRTDSQTGTVISIFISTSFIFFASETPFSVLQFLDHLRIVDCTNNLQRLVILTNHMVYLNAALNWIPYLIGARFRLHYCSTFCCCCNCWKKPAVQQHQRQQQHQQQQPLQKQKVASGNTYSSINDDEAENDEATTAV